MYIKVNGRNNDRHSLSFDWNHMAFFGDGSSKSICGYKNGITCSPVWDKLYGKSLLQNTSEKNLLRSNNWIYRIFWVFSFLWNSFWIQICKR